MDPAGAPISELQYWVGQGGFAIAFFLTFYFNRKDAKARDDEYKAQIATMQADRAVLIQVVKDNAAASAQNAVSSANLSAVIEAFHRRLDIDSDIRIRRRDVN